ncbi:glycosyltransferase family 2 protein [Flexithrix dorotheae]|uniref:glycosyltransferase family 2 protein n=1 Tax=Flexithrix dorotheae TaxID=70993 RepID=UPI000366E7D4|nr:glycosyltransferase family 2 protein [Flexithrix dorotheae]
MDRFKFSLIIPTLNRSKELIILLHSLKKQSFDDFEIIIIDQNKDDKVNQIITKHGDGLNINIKKISKSGASIARNEGINLAKGDIITFPDDDCEYAEGLLNEVSDIFKSRRDLDGITLSSKDKSGEGAMVRFSDEPGVINKFNVLKKMVEFTVFVRKESLSEIRFDETFGPGAKSGYWCDEGPDLILRLLEKGCRFEFFPNLVIYHPNPTRKFNKKIFKRSYRYGLARGRFIRLHKYPIWFAFYIWGLYLAGVILGLLHFNLKESYYYIIGLKGRVLGYFFHNRNI